MMISVIMFLFQKLTGVRTLYVTTEGPVLRESVTVQVIIQENFVIQVKTKEK